MIIIENINLDPHTGMEMDIDISQFDLPDNCFIRAILAQNNTYNMIVNCNVARSSIDYFHITIANSSDTIFKGDIYPIFIIHYSINIF